MAPKRVTSIYNRGICLVYFRIGSGSWANIEATKSITLWKVTESPIGKDRLATTIFQGRSVKRWGCIQVSDIKLAVIKMTKQPGGLAFSFSPSKDLTDYFFDIAEVYLASMEGDPGCEYVAGDWCSLGFWKRRNQEEARKWLGLGDVLSHIYLHLPSKSTKCR